MLLNDISRHSVTTLKKINQHLESNYGFKITEDVQDHDLVAIMETIRGEIADLKIKGNDAKSSPEISKRLLVLEGLSTLREFAMLQFQPPDLEPVIAKMVSAVVNHFTVGGTTQADLDEGIRDAMKVYRSSKYRFPDDYVEQRVRDATIAALQGNNAQPATATPVGMIEDTIADVEDDASSDSAMQGIGEDLGKEERYADQEWHHSAQNATHKSKQDQVPMIKNPHTGQLQADPFAAKAAAKKKELAMRENKSLVKNLRRLLETEVSQAEVMMAAKKFAEELQEMVEKIGRLQNEDLPPVTDQMRETYGMESASAFQTQIYSSFQGVMDSLYTAKGQVDDAVDNMANTGQVTAAVDMDKDISMGADDMGDDAELDLDNIGDELSNDMGDDADIEEPLGRTMKTESLKHKVVEMQQLVARARKLKESTK